MSLENKDVSREWYTFHKGIQFFKTMFSRKFTDVLWAFHKFEDINFSKLQKLGIKWIIIDFDECVAEHHWELLPQNLEKIKWALNLWLKIIVYSNKEKTNRYEVLENMWIEVITSKYAKPNPRWFKECLEKLWFRADEVVMIWDNYITDGWCMTLGIHFIKVKPIDSPNAKKDFPRMFQIFTRHCVDFMAENLYWTLKYWELKYSESTVE